MIIKSMSRKEPSFGQLVAYMEDIEKSDTQYNIYRNLYGRKLDDIESEFNDNAKYIFKRKNGVYLYHEILSITKSKTLDVSRQKEILRDLAYEYAEKRAPNNLVFGALHDDHEGHLHYHFCISANPLTESKKTRMSKAEFDQFKKGMEKLALEQYPELEQKIVINKEASEKLSNKGAEIKRRTGKTPQRDIVKEKLSKIFSECDTKQAFFEAMSDEGFETYVRGKAIGVRDIENDRKHRLKTLGLLDEFNAMSARIKLDEASNAEQFRADAHGQPDVDMKTKLYNIFAQSESKPCFFNAMEKAGFEVYVRGKTVGVLDVAQGKKHRLKTLGLLDAFNSMSDRIKLDEASSEEKSTQTDGNERDTVSAKKVAKTDRHATSHQQAETDTAQNTENEENTSADEKETATSRTTEQAEQQNETEIEREQARRKAEIEKKRESQRKHEQNNQQDKGKKQWIRQLMLWVKHNVSRVIASQLNKILTYQPLKWKQKTSLHSRSK